MCQLSVGGATNHRLRYRDEMVTRNLRKDESMNPAIPRTAHSYAYETLREQILSGTLAPGAPLVQTTLADQLSISMTPIREALRDLATEGLVTQSPHRGAIVTVVDVADALEINEIRLKLEPAAAAEAVLVISDADLEIAEQLHARLLNATDEEFVALNREFHAHLLASTPSKRLRGILTSLLEVAALYVGVALSHRQGPAPQHEHREILDAYKSRNPEAAAEAVASHIRSSLRSLKEAEIQ